MGRSKGEHIVTSGTAQSARRVHRISASAAMFRAGEVPHSSEEREGWNGPRADQRTLGGICWLLAVFGCLAAWGQPAAPTGLSATVGDGQANLRWTAASGVTGYQVRHGTGSPLAFDVWTTVSATTTTATFSGLTNGTRYALEVRAVSALGSGAAARVWAALATSPSAAVTIPDAALRGQIDIYLSKSAGETITQLEMANMSTLVGEAVGVSSLSGLEYALNLRSLHLQGNSISDLSALSGLLSLGTLSLARNSITDLSPLSNLTALRWLTLSENNISNISALTNLTALRYLHLWQNQISDISALSGLTSLLELLLQSNSISDISALSGLTSLTALFLHRNSITDISALSNMTALRTLNLSRNNSISDISSLSGLTSLTTLNLLTNSITNVSPLASSTALTWLALANNDVSDISALSNLTAMQRLYLSHNSISNISSLSGLTSLRTLDLSYNNSLSDISHLSTLTTLRVMSLSSNMISDISHLSNLRSLTTLYLSDNSISDISDLSGLTALVRLRLSGNMISDLSHLSGLTSLTQLYLSDNQISNISHLSTLTALSSLRLAENTIADISALVANAGLATGDSVDLRTNLLNVAAIQTHIPALQTRGVTVQFDPPSAAVSATNPMPLVEGSLNNATVTVTLNSTAFASGVSASSFTLATDVPGLTIGSAATPPSGATSTTLTLAHTGANFDDARSLTVTVAAAAHALDGDLTTSAVAVAPMRAVTLSTSTLTVQENNSATYTVRLASRPTGGDVTVTITGARSGITVSVTSLTFTGTNWNMPQQVRVEAAEDGNIVRESVTLTHTPSGAGTDYAAVAAAELSVIAADNDTPGLRLEPAEGLQLEESGAVGTYTARLRFAPSASVAVTISSDETAVVVDADGGTPLDQDTLTFNATNWSTAQTVTVRAESDADAASETATLLHTGSGAGSGYEGVTATYTVRVLDADAAPAPTGVSASAAGPTSLAVRWTPSPGAEGHVVQWRLPGQAWSTAQQLTLAGGAGSARIDGLTTGVEYEVRVLGLNRGDPGDASTPARATPRSLGPVNRAPVAIAAFEDRMLILGAALVFDLRGAFTDPDGDALEYTALSLDPSVVEAAVSGTELRLRAVGVGTAGVHVYATDPGGLTGSQMLLARVTDRVLLAASDAQAPEGGTAQVLVRLSLARATSTRIVWSIALDADAATADADDLVETSGEVTIPAGKTEAEIAIAIADDEDIEPAREWFEVSLSAPDGCCGTVPVRARVTVREGVCDRTPAVRDALRGSASCDAPTPATLAAVARLDVSDAGAGALQADDFAGLAALRTLLLDGNGLETLPDDLFAGLSGLRELSLENNPGAPFELAVELARTDADTWAPGPATVQPRFALGAPFALRSELSAEPAAAGLPGTVEIDAGATSAAPFTVASTSTLRLLAGPSALPTAPCGEVPCFRGVETVPGEALVLYRRPPQAQPAPQTEPLRSGDDLRLALESLIRPGDGDPGDLRWQASSSDESVATARVVGGHLVVTPAPGGEGAVRIVLEVVDDETGLAARRPFEVQVEFHWPARPTSGWRANALIDAARPASP